MSDNTVLDEAESERHMQKLSEAIAKGDEDEVARLVSQEVLDGSETVETPETPQGEEGKEETSTETPEGGEQPPEGETGQGSTEEDWIASLPEEVRTKAQEERLRNQQLQEQLARATHASRSDAGRIRAYQQKLVDLERGGTASAKPATSAPNTGDRGSAGLEALAAEDPELAKALEAFGNKIREEASADAKHAVESYLKPIQEDNFKSYVEDQKRVVRDTIPNVAEVTSSDHFQDWLHSPHNSDSVRQMAFSPHAADGLNVMRLYGTYIDEIEARNRPNTPTAPTTPVDNTAADKVAGARATRPQAPAKPTEAKVTSLAKELDLDALLNQEIEKARKEIGRY